MEKVDFLKTYKNEIEAIVKNALAEDIGDGDHTSLATIPDTAQGEAKLLVKDDGILAGVELAEYIFNYFDPNLQIEVFIKDGTEVKKGDVAFHVKGSSRSILSTERLVLNFMQRMSGVATKTHELAKLIAHLPTKLLDTRKTTPGIRIMEKWAVTIGGGHNHRMALYDMVMIKDNHIDYAGGIKDAIERTKQYLIYQGKRLKIEVESRNIDEVKEILAAGGVDRIMLDNYSPNEIVEALKIIPDEIETEASGGIDETTILSYAETGVDYISSGAVTHSFKSLDLSLKAVYHKD
ncbi:MAG: carboxylating nicotinate-nucleotide diphosphorylase [Crocinitomicaceae bacterium]|nr:carboxylating nicotinate-nucleotide diphosphorylase [Crocinitomicaceae bacterium]